MKRRDFMKLSGAADASAGVIPPMLKAVLIV